MIILAISPLGLLVWLVVYAWCSDGDPRPVEFRND